jgi:cation transport ATPase
MSRATSTLIAILRTKEIAIAAVSILAIGLHLLLRFGTQSTGALFGVPTHAIPLFFALAGGLPLLFGLLIHLSRLEFSADLLAGISIVTSVILGEYLAGTLVVLMLSGGQALEAYAVRRPRN